MSHKLPELNYDYSALEPYIDGQTMEIHHSKHHAGYVNNLNAALENASVLQGKDVEQLLTNLGAVPDNISTAVRNNGGGHFNHTLFWSLMGPNAGGQAEGDLAKAINDAFGGFESFKEQFSKAGATRFGSGWAWLALDAGNELKVLSTANQDNPVSEGLKPVLGLDVWEHAYYLKYQNRRPEYIDNWWNVVNWEAVGARYKALAK